MDRGAGRYLVAIYRASPDAAERVRTGEVGERIDVSPASVTEAFGRLAAEGLVDYQKRRGVALTDRGREVAVDLAARECAVRRFFAGELDVELSGADAYRVGFQLPEDGIERLDELAGPRERCCRAERRGEPADDPRGEPGDGQCHGLDDDRREDCCSGE